MTKRERKKIAEAMDVLQEAESAVGESGPTIDEMNAEWAQGRHYGDDAFYDTCQHVWRLLETTTKGAI